MKKNILIVDADKELCLFLSQYLKAEGFETECCHDGKEALKKVLQQSFEAIILDIMLPNHNGFEILKTIRKHLQTPVLMLSSREDNIDKIISLEMGADDYLPKPCNPQELLARLRAILRRTQNTAAQRPIIEHSGLKIDCNQHLVTRDGQTLELTNAEFNILELLVKSPGKAFSKEELTVYALGRKFTAFDRSIDVHISNLRNKLGEHQEGEGLLKTVRGFGYMLQA